MTCIYLYLIYFAGYCCVDPLIIDWQPTMDRYFIELMLEQMHGGNKIDHTFNEQAWTHMVESFNEKFQLTCDKYILENRYITLMKECENISSLLNCSGFSWDATQQMVIADDAVWESYIQVNSSLGIIFRILIVICKATLQFSSRL